MADRVYKKIYSAISKIPYGKVCTYGILASMIVDVSGPRQIGYALHQLNEGTDVPWWRVINSGGKISFPLTSENYYIQRAILESEGVEFNLHGKIDLKKYCWRYKSSMNRK